jgi:hypothetical protein
VCQIRARLDPGDRLPDFGIEVAEGLEGERRSQPGIRLDLGLDLIVSERLHAALAVMDEHDLGGIQQTLGDDQRPDHVIGHHPTRVADDVGVPGLEPEHRVDVQTRVHAGDDGHAHGRPRGQVVAGEFGGTAFGIRQESVDRVHAAPPVTNTSVLAGQAIVT